MKFKVFTVFVFFSCIQFWGTGFAKNKVVVIPLMSDQVISPKTSVIKMVTTSMAAGIILLR